jgi:hypothetical protein
MFPKQTKRDELFNLYRAPGNLNFSSHTRSEAHIVKTEFKAASTLLQIRKQECPRCLNIKAHKLSVGCTQCCSIYEHGILIGRLSPEALFGMFKRDPDHHIGYMGFLLHGGKFAPFAHPVRLPKTAGAYKVLLGLKKDVVVDWEQPGLVQHFKVPFCSPSCSVEELEPLLGGRLKRCKRCKLILLCGNPNLLVVLGRPFLFSPKEVEEWYLTKEVQALMAQDPLLV